MTHRQTRIALVVLIAAGGPLLLGMDLVLQRILVEQQPEDVRQFIGEMATRFAWYVVPCPALGGAVGFWLYPRLYRRHLERSTMKDREKAEQNADLLALMLAASLPQLPALLGDLSVILGGELKPALCSTALSTISVLLIALVAPRFRAVS